MNNYPADLADFRYHRLFSLLHDENSDSSIQLALESLFSNEQVAIELLQKKIQALEKHSSRFFLWRSFSWLINYDNIYHDIRRQLGLPVFNILFLRGLTPKIY